MKKFIISILFILVFGIYVWHQRKGTEAQTNLIPAQTASTNQSGGLQGALADDAPVPNTNATPSTTAPKPSPSPTPAPAPVSKNSIYKDGTFTGTSEYAFYGYVQVQATIQNDKITKVTFLDYPHDRRESIQINSQATPWLSQEAIAAQSANVNIISGATDTSIAFRRSLQNAINSAKI